MLVKYQHYTVPKRENFGASKKTNKAEGHFSAKLVGKREIMKDDIVLYDSVREA